MTRSVRTVGLLLLGARICLPHVISMSTGDITVRGKEIDYILRMPAYELRSTQDSAALIFDQIEIRSNGETAQRTAAECHADPERSQYLCAASYSFSYEPGDIEVRCRLDRATVPNHAHMLRAERRGKFDTAILDASFPDAVLRFRPLTAFEIGALQFGAGLMRTLTSPALLLLLCALSAAGRGWRERVLFMLCFVLGEALSAIFLMRSVWQPSSRFAEAAVALSLAYLSLELMLWPRSGGRWMLGLAFGAFSGMFYSAFLQASGFGPVPVLLGAATMAAFVIALSGVAITALVKTRLLRGSAPVLPRLAAGAIFVTGVAWFVVRLRS